MESTILQQHGYTIPQAEAVSPWKRGKLYKLMRDGVLPYTVIGGQRIIPRSALVRLIEGELDSEPNRASGRERDDAGRFLPGQGAAP